jgi:hypothetical protein
MVEFSFDVTEVGRGTFKSDAYQSLIGFEVAVPVMERAFREIYGLELKDVFGDADLAIGTYRHAASELIPQITRAAWKDKRKEILEANPTLVERDVVYTLTRVQYEQAFGTTYRKPGFLARFVVGVFKILPKFGPFKPLAFQPLTPASEQMFLDSFERARQRYGEWVRAARRSELSLRDTDLDTGEATARGQNPLADETYDELLKRVAGEKTVALNPALHRVITEHYGSSREGPRARPVKASHQRKLSKYLAALDAR